MSTTRDRLYSEPLQDISGFEFDASVAAVFPDMIQRSVPGYASVVAMSGFLAQRFAQAGTCVYDLGCSLGATSLAIANALQAAHKDCEIIAVDNSPAMLQQARANLDAGGAQAHIRFECADILQFEVENASLIALNYTLQFIAPAQRKGLLAKLAAAMQPGGVLLLSEKVMFEDGQVDQLYIDLHHDFKRSKGYSELEVSQKRASLEDVLVPETLAVHRQRLLDAGFSRVEPWFQCLNFASLLAFR